MSMAKAKWFLTDASIRNVTKIAASLLIVFHLIAVFCAPASVEPASKLSQGVWSCCSYYLQATYLNHGYHFFAPEPGSSSTLEYVGVTEDGSRVFGRIPDKERMNPRLLYHRHFMLTEFLGSVPSTATETRRAVVHSYSQQLMTQHNLQTIEMKLVRHRPSSRQEILLGGKLNDPNTFEYEPLGTFTWSDK